MKADVGPLVRLLSFRATGDLGPYTFFTRQGERTVFFLRAPPRKPRTWLQNQNLARWTAIATLWQALTETNRANWTRLAALTHLRITPYNLFVHWQTRPADLTVDTLLRQAGMTWQDLTDPGA